MKRVVGLFLSTHRLRHGELKALAERLMTTSRTLRNWRDREGTSGLPGQPPHGEDARKQAREHVGRVWPSLPRGHDGWRSVITMLAREEIQVPTRLVQAAVRELKRERAERERVRIEENRVHVEVLARDAMWALDQTHLMRDEQGEVKCLAVRESLAPHLLGLSIGPPACGKDVARLLEQVAGERGTWPLVIQADNGPENRNIDVAELLARERVIVLWNEPRTPQHNARMERSFGSLKAASELEALRTPTRSRVCARILEAWQRLDARTPRASLGGLTPVELDAIAPPAEDRVSRARFYTEVSGTLRRIALAPHNARARRKAEREAIWSALQRYGLVTRTRGGCLVPTAKAEGIS